MENTNQKGETLQTTEAVRVSETANKKKTKEVVFKNCKTYGDEIKALVRKYLDNPIKTFVLEKAIEEINEKSEKLEAYKEKLLNQKGAENETRNSGK